MTGDHRLTLRKAFKALVGTAAGKGGGIYTNEGTGKPVPESLQRQPVSAVPGG